LDAVERIAQLESAVAARDAQIAEQQAQIAEQQAQIAEQQAQIAEQQAQIAEQQAQIVEQQARIVEQQARIAALEKQVGVLLEQVAVLTEQVRQDSSNSHKPPSSDPPGTGKDKSQGKKKRGKTKRKRGGQPGHKGHHRELLPASEVNEFVEHYPPQCESCWEVLPEVPDPHATRFQITEVPPVVPHTTEHRCHAVRCRCGYRTRGRLGPDVPRSPFGPRLMAIIGLLSGAYHLSRRKTAALLRDLCGVRVSVGAVSAVEARVSDAVAPPVHEAWTKVEHARVKHTDGTGWLQAGVALAVWTIATTAATVFKIVADSSKATLEPLYGALRGILVSDRATALTFWAMERRQVCWAHLLRRFVSFSERDGPAAVFGRQLLDYTGLVFEYWHAYRDGAISRATFRAWMKPVRAGVEELLERAAAADLKRLSGSCANLLEHRQALWTFVDTDGVEPTNNHAERELRAFVLWRKRSFGSQSERGNQFAERLMTVVHTARKQRRDVLAFLTDCCQAYCDGAPPPSLFGEPEQTALRAAA
jgi:transposase